MSVKEGTKQELKFLHYRYPVVEMSPSKDCYVLVGWDSRGGRTYAYRDRGDGGFDVAVSKCHINDNFNKRLGRARSAGRLDSRQDGDVVVIPGTYEEVLAYCNTDAENYGMLRKYAGRDKQPVAAEVVS